MLTDSIGARTAESLGPGHELPNLMESRAPSAIGTADELLAGASFGQIPGIGRFSGRCSSQTTRWIMLRSWCWLEPSMMRRLAVRTGCQAARGRAGVARLGWPRKELWSDWTLVAGPQGPHLRGESSGRSPPVEHGSSWATAPQLNVVAVDLAPQL